MARLIEKGADIRARDAAGQNVLHYALLRAQQNPIHLYGQKDKPAEDAARYLGLIRFLISKGADVNARDNQDDTPLKLALRINRPDAAAALRKAGAKP